MRRMLKWAFHQLGYDVIRNVPTLEHGFQVLPYVVAERMHAHFFFVQVGANDGVLDDPLRGLILKHDLTGVLVEPMPGTFQALVDAYPNRRRLSFENAAISDREGNVALYRVRPDAHVGQELAWHRGVQSRRSCGTMAFPPKASKRSRCRRRRCRVSWSGTASASSTCFRSTAEGHDGVIVRHALRSGLRPAIINYEAVHMPPEERYETRGLLKECGYRFIDIERDDAGGSACVSPDGSPQRSALRIRSTPSPGALATNGAAHERSRTRGSGPSRIENIGMTSEGSARARRFPMGS